ncbi:mannosyltransferase [Nocardia aurantia]|uniref:Polyprenol-phosphate-mannose-dependent alpha-(1-2)-phosphatidylinositol pentamannoside mannosyltransferase n=1 Tax=Nocardia aurantia TaxID=2585199 RepID=A0A7K0DUQ2_9NOCA|nr:mannosyltransferase [Nocardia aurantia]MQY28554.1 Polyprenol-phosphate-mannose-dependent alpha-(1-2)-phosphatidylinositol pentamannoside mannosyltransferase [Nocardia aurantia]
MRAVTRLLAGTHLTGGNRGRLAIAALALSVLARLLWMLLSPNGINVVDLHVYVNGAHELGTGHLYDFTYADKTPDFPLPFTYPPFAAIVFYPLHWLPFTAVAVGWTLLTAAALYAVVRICLTMLVGERAQTESWRTAAVAWTAVGLWLEPVRTTLDYGQVNVFLVLAAILAAYSSLWWLSGLLVGAAAGIKLTPAVTGLYFLTQRRWASAVWAAAVFAGTVGVSLLISPAETRTYFGPLIGDANRIGPVGSVWNQSLRGALSRILGRDAGAPWYLHGHRIPEGPWWLGGIAVVAVLAVFAWRAVGSDDRLGTLLVVQLFGLMVSPISWSHHWVWLLPLILWLLYGPLRAVRGARLLAGYWLVTMLIGVPWVLSFAQPSIWTIPRPAVLAWLGAVDVIGVLVLFGWLIRAGRGRAVTPTDRPADLSREPAAHPAG